jgi:hypothetical protein
MLNCRRDDGSRFDHPRNGSREKVKESDYGRAFLVNDLVSSILYCLSLSAATEKDSPSSLVEKLLSISEFVRFFPPDVIMLPKVAPPAAKVQPGYRLKSIILETYVS